MYISKLLVTKVQILMSNFLYL